MTYNGTDRACQGDPQLTSARITANFSNVTLTCEFSKAAGRGSGTIQWSDGSTSQVDLSIDGSELNNAHVSGTVKSGPHAGQPFSGTFTTDLAGGAWDCATTGVSKVDFTGNYTIG